MEHSVTLLFTNFTNSCMQMLVIGQGRKHNDTENEEEDDRAFILTCSGMALNIKAIESLLITCET